MLSNNDDSKSKTVSEQCAQMLHLPRAVSITLQGLIDDAVSIVAQFAWCWSEKQTAQLSHTTVSKWLEQPAGSHRLESA